MSNATIEIIDFGGDNQRELETSGDTSCSLHQVECKEGLKVTKMMATDGRTEDINEFLSSLGHCFDKALKDECNSVPLDYTESGLEDHLQIVKLSNCQF